MYKFRVYKTQVESHAFFVAESTCLKGCVGQGNTFDEAIRELEENEAVWLETAKECGIEIPRIPHETIVEFKT